MPRPAPDPRAGRHRPAPAATARPWAPAPAPAPRPRRRPPPARDRPTESHRRPASQRRHRRRSMPPSSPAARSRPSPAASAPAPRRCGRPTARRPRARRTRPRHPAAPPAGSVRPAVSRPAPRPGNPSPFSAFSEVRHPVVGQRAHRQRAGIDAQLHAEIGPHPVPRRKSMRDQPHVADLRAIGSADQAMRIDRRAARIGDRPLLQHRHTMAVAHQRPGRAQPGDAGADDQDVHVVKCPRTAGWSVERFTASPSSASRGRARVPRCRRRR